MNCKAITGVLIFALVLLSSCSRPYHRYRNSFVNQDVTPGIPQRANVTDKRTYQLAHALHEDGVDIITIGQDYRVIIPVEKLFYYSTPRIMWGSYGRLNMVVDYLKQFRKVSVRVEAYSRDKDKKLAGALSYARARAVADYLWSQAIDTRLLTTQAHSMERSISGDDQDDGSNSDIHSHIEIIFRNVII